MDAWGLFLYDAIFGHEVKAKKGLHKTILHNGYSHSPGALQEKELKR